MTRRWYPFAGRLVLALALLAASFLIMALTLAPRTGEVALPFTAAVDPEMGHPARVLTAAVAGARSAGDLAPDSQALMEHARVFVPALSSGGEVVLPSADFIAFGESLNAVVAPHDGTTRYAIAVTDLQTGHTVGANHERQQLSGCVMNFFVILRAVLDVQEGRYPLETVDGLIRATTWSSNATTARELYRIAGDGDAAEGVRRVAALHADLGLDGVLIDHPPAYGGDSLGIDFNNWLTADSMNMALAAAWRSEMLDAGNRDYLMEVLAEVKPGLNYLTAYVPGDAVVSHKNGFFPSDIGYIDNDAGIVQVGGPGGYAYVVTFLAEGAPYKYADLPLGQELMRMTWEWFAARYAG